MIFKKEIDFYLFPNCNNLKTIINLVVVFLLCFAILSYFFKFIQKFYVETFTALVILTISIYLYYVRKKIANCFR